jgi:DNA-binding NarL/FixJ family response regulator
MSRASASHVRTSWYCAAQCLHPSAHSDSPQTLSEPTAIGALSRSMGEPSYGAAEPITVVLGRFDALLARGLTQILREDRDIEIIGSDLDRAALAQAVSAQAPQVAVINEAEVADPSALDRLMAARQAIGIVVLAHLPTVAYGTRLFAEGVSCVAKEASAENILAAVHIAADGRRAFVADDGHLVERSHPAAVASLTPREAEVLEYLSKGRSHSEIAHALQLGVETVRTHAAHIRGKLGVRNKRELIGLAIPVQSATETQ